MTLDIEVEKRHMRTFISAFFYLLERNDSYDSYSMSLALQGQLLYSNFKTKQLTGHISLQKYITRLNYASVL